MYIVKIGNTKIYDPRIDDLTLINPVVELEENSAGSFSFTMPPDHPYYDLIKKRKSIIQVYQDDDLIFSGMAIETEVDFYMQKYVYCEGELSYLNDSIQRPARYQGVTVRGLLETYINNHNAQVEAEKQFKVGMVTVTDPNNYLYCYSNMESTMTCLKEDLSDDLGGYFRVRHVNGVKYIDYLADSQRTCNQVIKLGENLLDFTSNIDSTDIATAIIPLGAKLEDSPVEGLEVRLDIKSVNNDLDYVCNQTAIQNYGWIYKTVEWDNVTTAEALKKKGQQYLSEIQFENMVIEAKAIDLHFVDSDEQGFKLSDQIRVISAPHGLNKYFRLTKQTINLNNPENDTITLGKEERISLSAKTNQVNAAIYKAMESITTPSKILQQAKDNALALLNGSVGGHVIFNFDKDNKYVEEILICDSSKEENSTKKWVWNLNGFGYMYRKSLSDEWTDLNVAITMDGAIVADFITSGTMSADRMRGGTLEVGGKGYGKEGKIEVKNESGTVLITLDKSGMTLSGGQTISWGNLSNVPDDLAKTGDIPTDVNQLSDSSGQKWSTSVGDTWIQTATVTAQNLTAGHVSAEAIGTSELAANAITSEKISSNAITSEKINAGAITSEKISSSAITSEKISSNAITSDKINANAITSEKINAGAIGTDELAANAVTSAKISVDSLSAISADIGSVTAGSISGVSITGGSLKQESGSDGVDISSGKIKAWGTWLDLRKVENSDDKQLALGYDKSACRRAGDGYHRELDSKWILEAAQNAKDGSDRRLKREIEKIPIELSKAILSRIDPVSFYYIKDEDEMSEGKRYGVIAQDLREILDDIGENDAYIEHSRYESDGTRTVEYKDFIAHLINVIQDQQKDINKLKERMEGTND